MLADILTKPLGGDHYHHLVNIILSYVPYSSNRGAKEKNGKVAMPRQTMQMVTELADSLSHLNCCHQGTTQATGGKKHKCDLQNSRSSRKQPKN
jgi:hypothetical protein